MLLYQNKNLRGSRGSSCKSTNSSAECEAPESWLSDGAGGAGLLKSSAPASSAMSGSPREPLESRVDAGAGAIPPPIWQVHSASQPTGAHLSRPRSRLKLLWYQIMDGPCKRVGLRRICETVQRITVIHTGLMRKTKEAASLALSKHMTPYCCVLCLRAIKGPSSLRRHLLTAHRAAMLIEWGEAADYHGTTADQVRFLVKGVPEDDALYADVRERFGGKKHVQCSEVRQEPPRRPRYPASNRKWWPWLRRRRDRPSLSNRLEGPFPAESTGSRVIVLLTTNRSLDFILSKFDDLLLKAELTGRFPLVSSLSCYLFLFPLGFRQDLPKERRK